MPNVTEALRDARDLLLVANRDNPKAVGDFGYTVDDSPQAKAKAALNRRVFSCCYARRPAARAALRASARERKLPRFDYLSPAVEDESCECSMKIVLLRPI